MDVSDGLLLDSWRMAQASRKCFEIDSGSIPAADPERRDECMRWGDDYQLLFTTSDGNPLPVSATRIGTVLSGPLGLLLDGDMLTPEDDLGYRH